MPTVTAVLVVPGVEDVPVANGQLIEFDIDDETEIESDDGVLEIEAPSLTLRVTAVDASGNMATTDVPVPDGGDSD